MLCMHVTSVCRVESIEVHQTSYQSKPLNGVEPHSDAATVSDTSIDRDVKTSDDDG
jgi:hypothetical protein